MSKIRLDKFLSNMGVGTRTEVKKLIGKQRVFVNELCARGPEQKIDTEQDIVTVDGNRITFTSYEYWMLHKPSGVVSATEDKKDKTVLDLMEGCNSPFWKELFPVGRLDKDTEGLLLLTNDGELAHNLLSPKKHVSKVYYAKIEGNVTEKEVQLFADGLVVDSELTALPAKLEIIKSDLQSEINLEICEGKFHQVKRMFQAVGKRVLYLKRISMGGLVLDHMLMPGEYRKLSEEEVHVLKSHQKPGK